MLTREDLERREEQLLAPYAMLSSKSRGRAYLQLPQLFRVLLRLHREPPGLPGRFHRSRGRGTLDWTWAIVVGAIVLRVAVICWPGARIHDLELQEGFLRTEPRRGIFIVRKTKKQIIEMIEIWAALESMAARLATLNASDADIAALRRMFDEFRTSTPAEHIDEYSDANIAFHQAIEAAAERATKAILLRPNAVHPLTGKNSGTNVGVNAPYVTFKAWAKDEVRVRLMLKGGGSENVGTQYKLPDGALGAGRDLKGVRKCVVDAVFKAQGMGCAPGVIGVGIGGDRATSYLLSKEQFFRRLGSANEDPALDAFEKELHADLNRLGIGPMGFGGRTTVLGVFAGWQHRHPATFYVAVSYMCWACRRKEMTLRNGEAFHDPA